MSRRRGKGRGVDKKGRSTGSGRFAPLYEWQAESEAYRALKAGPRALLAEMKLLYTGSNNGRLFLSVRDAAVLLHTDKQTAAAWLWALEHTGFIRARFRGSQDVKARHATTWILTEYGVGDAVPSKDFMRWRPGMSFADRPPGKSWAHSATAALATPSPSRRELFGDEAKNKSRGGYATQAVHLCHPDGSERASESANLSTCATQISPVCGVHGVAVPPTSMCTREGAMNDAPLRQAPTLIPASDSAAAPTAGMTVAVSPPAPTPKPHVPDVDGSCRDETDTHGGDDEQPRRRAPKKLGAASRAKNGGGFVIGSAADVTMALQVGVVWMDLAQQAIALDIAERKRARRPSKAALASLRDQVRHALEGMPITGDDEAPGRAAAA